jgi:hypothetical protein
MAVRECGRELSDGRIAKMKELVSFEGGSKSYLSCDHELSVTGRPASVTETEGGILSYKYALFLSGWCKYSAVWEP